MQDRFVYTLDFETKIEQALSSERLDSYRELLPQPASFANTIKLYNANTALSEALVGSIQIMEIALRNTIHREIARTYGDDWYIANKLNLDNRGEASVTRIYNKYRNMKQKGIAPAPLLFDTPKKLSEKIISELTLGFWSSLFQSQYEDPLWRKTLRQAFPHVGGSLTRSTVYTILDKIRRLRNRISHHEQIIRYDLNVYYNDIINMVSWINPVAAIWLSHHNRFYEVKTQFAEELALIVLPR